MVVVKQLILLTAVPVRVRSKYKLMWPTKCSVPLTPCFPEKKMINLLFYSNEKKENLADERRA